MKKYLKYFPFYLLSLFPLRFIYVLSDITAWTMHRILGYRLEIVRKNLKNSFPDKSQASLLAIEKKYYHHFCDIYFEALKSLTMSKRQLTKRMHIVNPELIETLKTNRKNIILYAAHYGNWEWFNALPLLLPYQCSTFFKKLSNDYFNEFIQMIRGRFGVMLFEHNKGYKSLVGMDTDEKLNMCYMIGDQTPRGKTTKYWTHFLNQPTAFFVGPDRIARKLDYALVFPLFQKTKRGQYEVTFKLLSENPKEMKGEAIMDAYIDQLEKAIQSSPEMWLWSHKRWRLKVPESMLE